MTEYFSDLTDAVPVARTIKHGKKTKTVHFRRVTAGERLQLAGNQTMTFGADGQRGAMEMSLADMARNRHMLVQFATVTADGVQVFGSLADVQAQPDWLVAELNRIATEVNKDAEDDAPNV